MRAFLLVLASCGGAAPPATPATVAPAAAPTTRCAFESDGVQLSIDAPGARAVKQALTTIVRKELVQLSINTKAQDQRATFVSGIRDGVERLRGAGYVILLDEAGTAPVVAQAVAQKDDLVAGSVLLDGEPKLILCSFEVDPGGAWKLAIQMCGSLRAAGNAPPCAS